MLPATFPPRLSISSFKAFLLGYPVRVPVITKIFPERSVLSDAFSFSGWIFNSAHKSVYSLIFSLNQLMMEEAFTFPIPFIVINFSNAFSEKTRFTRVSATGSASSFWRIFATSCPTPGIPSA